MSLLANESNYNLKFIDHVARQRFDFLESLIEKDPTNEHLIVAYQKLFEFVFKLEEQNLLADKSIKEKELELEKVCMEERLKRNDG